MTEEMSQEERDRKSEELMRKALSDFIEVAKATGEEIHFLCDEEGIPKYVEGETFLCSAETGWIDKDKRVNEEIIDDEELFSDFGRYLNVLRKVLAGEAATYWIDEHGEPEEPDATNEHIKERLAFLIVVLTDLFIKFHSTEQHPRFISREETGDIIGIDCVNKAVYGFDDKNKFVKFIVPPKKDKFRVIKGKKE